MKIIIIEDDVIIREELNLLLKNALYETVIITDFTNVTEQVVKEEPDLVLLDINLPSQSGLTICTEIRKVLDTPIIFVTSNNTSMDELNCMMLGGDDYVTKPYNPPILLARIAVILKRTKKVKDETIIHYKGAILDLESYTISRSKGQVELTKNEFKILSYLFKNSGKVIPRLDLIEYLWDNEVFIDDNTLSVNITRIRNKLEQIGLENFIETKRGVGYKV